VGERAKVAGIPERFAMQNLGHNSEALHRAYAKKALVKIPSLQEDGEQNIDRIKIHRGQKFSLALI
jgi:hypothetical protein